jgi:hypothetical protein
MRRNLHRYYDTKSLVRVIEMMVGRKLLSADEAMHGNHADRLIRYIHQENVFHLAGAGAGWCSWRIWCCWRNLASSRQNVRQN